MTYLEKLKMRKTKLQLNGWHQMGHVARCGYYWIHADYPNLKFSIHEAERIQKIFRKDLAYEQKK